jgi:hypothetical protein
MTQTMVGATDTIFCTVVTIVSLVVKMVFITRTWFRFWRPRSL